jgi:radial spoke head protein 9
MFWGRIDGIKNDYYIAMGVTYTDKFEFPEKRFFWALSTDFKFKPFTTLNDQNADKFDSIKGLFLGDPNLVHIRVVAEKSEEEAAQEQVKVVPSEKDPLASTEEEDPNAGFVPRNFTELDRLHYSVYAIENDCHIVPKGAMKLTE